MKKFEMSGCKDRRIEKIRFITSLQCLLSFNYFKNKHWWKLNRKSLINELEVIVMLDKKKYTNLWYECNGININNWISVFK